jgi:hypothetical protein
VSSRLLSRLNDRQAKFQSPRSNRESFLVTGLWTLILFFIAIPNGLASRIGGIGLSNSATSLQIRKAWGSGDAGSLLDTAITWEHGHQIDATTQFWIVHLWSPGMSIVEIPLIWLEHLGIPLFWSLLSVTVLLWSTIFYLTWKYGSVLVGRITLSLVSLLLLFSWDFRYIFRDDLFYTEGLGYGLLLLSLLLMSWLVLNPENPRKRKLAILAGVCLGLSIWIRHVSDSGMILFLVISLLLLIWNLRIKGQARQDRNSWKHAKVRASKTSKQSSKTITRKAAELNLRIKAERKSKWIKLGALPYLTLSALIAFLVTLPWRIISPLVFNGWPGYMSSASATVWHAVWEQNGTDTIQYWGQYGMNWACNIDIKTCLTLNANLYSSKNNSLLTHDAIRAAIFHPIAYLQNRGSYAFHNWIPSGNHLPPVIQIASATAGFLAIFASVYLYGRIIDSRKRLIALIWVPFIAMQLAQLAIIHYESRYFIPVRFLIIGFTLTLFALRPNRRTSLN